MAWMKLATRSTVPNMGLDVGLRYSEKVWVKRYTFLAHEHGYILRPRYRPGWTPPQKEFHEEFISIWFSQVLDATRVSDGQVVMLKPIDRKKFPREIEIQRYLTSVDNERNHALPILDWFPDALYATFAIAVLPLVRRIEDHPPQTIAECIDFVRQTLEGMAFLHEHRIAHLDAAPRNIMVDARALYPRGWHPQSGGRHANGKSMDPLAPEPSITAVGGVRYYFIDFGISTRDQDSVVGTWGVIKAPELSLEVPYNPYKTDVYILGMTYGEYILGEPRNPRLAFLVPLVLEMTRVLPEERLIIGEAIKRFRGIVTTEFGPSGLDPPLAAKPKRSALRAIKDTLRVLCRTKDDTTVPVELPPFV